MAGFVGIYNLESGPLIPGSGRLGLKYRHASLALA